MLTRQRSDSADMGERRASVKLWFKSDRAISMSSTSPVA
ncbi:hypothetical protein TG4357_00762 [Thalassovita gelatinovora]|uniref:Uncharacterized protein n=1 Tax=Thalassovita gelatinovora TaxID=53501 RepID=A0A0P1F6V0_THAGE|nr:hypothetical protein TG4357_00762 [Thalassovita gelatinovora]